MTRTVLYHANCYDGFCAAWCLEEWLWSDSDAEYIPISYSDAVPWEKIDGRDVIIADFSFKRPVMEEIFGRSSLCQVYDHHKTAEKELEGLSNCVFDMAKSGARLVWEGLCDPGEDLKIPNLVLFTEDRDLWKWELPYSKEINMAIRSYPFDFTVWSELESRLCEDRKPIIREGEAILRFQDQYIETMRKFVHPSSISGRTISVVNAPYFSISDLLDAICDDEKEAGRDPIAAAYFQRADGLWQYSLRSRGDIDVSEIARNHGGGGHKNAAGFEAEAPPSREWVATGISMKSEDEKQKIGNLEIMLSILRLARNLLKAQEDKDYRYYYNRLYESMICEEISKCSIDNHTFTIEGSGIKITQDIFNRMATASSELPVIGPEYAGVNTSIGRIGLGTTTPEFDVEIHNRQIIGSFFVEHELLLRDCRFLLDTSASQNMEIIDVDEFQKWLDTYKKVACFNCEFTM